MLNNAEKKKLVQNNVPASFPYLIEVWKESDTEKANCYRYANASEDKVFDSHTYTAGHFKLSLPEKNESGIKDTKLSISNVDMVWIERILEAKAERTRYKLRCVAVIDYDENNNEVISPIDDITFVITNATWQDLTIEWTLKFDEWKDIKMPCHKITQFTFPGLF